MSDRTDVRRLQHRVQALIARGVVDSVDDALQLQYADVSLWDGHKPTQVERFQQYGLTTVPLAEATEVLVAHEGGNTDHPIILAIDDRKYRLNNLKKGDVALYTHTGQKIHISPDDKKIRLESGPSSIEIDDSGIRLTAPHIWLNE